MKTEQVEVPNFEGYKCLGWKVPKVGEYFLSEGDLCAAKGYFRYEFLVYEKLSPKRYVFEETGEIRPVIKGEYYRSEYYGGVYTWDLDKPSHHRYIVLKLIDE